MTTLEPSVFNSLDRAGLESIMRSIADMVKALQDYAMPPSVKGYGGLQFDGQDVVVGPTAIPGRNERLRTSCSANKCDAYKLSLADTPGTCGNSSGPWLRRILCAAGGPRNLRNRVDKFVVQGFELLLARELDKTPRPTLFHASLSTSTAA